MASGKYNIEIEQGADWGLDLVWSDDAGVPISVAGWTARMQIRETYADTKVLLSLTTENGGIELNATPGKVSLRAPASLTDKITVTRGVYDVELIAQLGAVVRLIEGKVVISPSVTR